MVRIQSRAEVSDREGLMRALLIEDDRGTSLSIELILRSDGFNVFTSELGEEGLDRGKLHDYDIIVLDLSLPDMSGYDVLRGLRISKVNTPVLILSGAGGIEGSRDSALVPTIS
jgi:two-component system, cell cycle response regulator CtrA